ncbi:Fur family transcriptional regulator [Candidatus Palauibacter sp.]|uniref:Fur family transcriptional regulator n=1 Tax=Candidatus Palauibacter sp. TaxID=3101350 RepID=UPI003AF2E3B0
MNPLDAPTRGITPEELRRALEARGHRFTAQRAAVYRVLSGTTAHPTADDVFTSVREHIPDISLATVYKALEAFVTCGVARKLSLGAGPARYDGRTDEHEHIRCLSCGRVQDIEGLRPRDWMQGLSEMTPFDVVGYRLELEGYCPDCLH